MGQKWRSGISFLPSLLERGLHYWWKWRLGMSEPEAGKSGGCARSQNPAGCKVICIVWDGHHGRYIWIGPMWNSAATDKEPTPDEHEMGWGLAAVWEDGVGTLRVHGVTWLLETAKRPSVPLPIKTMLGSAREWANSILYCQIADGEAHSLLANAFLRDADKPDSRQTDRRSGGPGNHDGRRSKNKFWKRRAGTLRKQKYFWNCKKGWTYFNFIVSEENKILLMEVSGRKLHRRQACKSSIRSWKVLSFLIQDLLR